MNPTQIYVLHLMDCALSGCVPSPLPAGADFKAVVDIARLHNIEGLLWSALSKLDASQVPTNIAERLQSAALNTVYRRLQFDIERESVFESMAAAGLSYLPLKGVRIAAYYPDPSMRAMVDNDILYGFVEEVPASEQETWGRYRLRGIDKRNEFKVMNEASDILATIMRARGYSVESLKNGKHDTFHKQPMFNFEMHRRLIDTHKDERNYFTNPWRYAVLADVKADAEGAKDAKAPNSPDGFKVVDDENGAKSANATTNPTTLGSQVCGEFRFSPEEEYIHFLAHAWEHYSTNGVGIRTLADAHVILKAHEAAFDKAYLKEHLQMVGLVDFEVTLHEATRKLFGSTGDTQGANSQGAPAVDSADLGGITELDSTFCKKIDSLTPGEVAMVECMFKSGSHGSIQVSIERQLAADAARGIGGGASKLRYALGKIFVSPKKLKAKSDIYAKYPVLILFSPLQRLAYFIKYFATNPGEAKRVKTTLKNTQKS